MRRLAPIALIVLILDQFTKLLVLHTIDPQRPVEVVTGFFRLVNWQNTGAAWGMFQNGNVVLAVISVLTLIGLLVFRRAFQIDRVGNQVALGLIIGGIAGNVVDRFRLGSVVDFLDFYIGNHHWPAFNVADSAICVGVGLYLLLGWLTDRKTASPAQNA